LAIESTIVRMAIGAVLIADGCSMGDRPIDNRRIDNRRIVNRRIVNRRIVNRRIVDRQSAIADSIANRQSPFGN
jgi:hypothetical protein